MNPNTTNPNKPEPVDPAQPAVPTDVPAPITPVGPAIPPVPDFQKVEPEVVPPELQVPVEPPAQGVTGGVSTLPEETKEDSGGGTVPPTV